MMEKTLSHYKILDKIGAGGMGEVYRAEDLRLHRQVAIKVIPDLFAGDPERLARFEREAKLVAALNHPNIAAIYGLEEAEGKRFLVLELVEGETLARRLGPGPLPVDEALEVCRQIAEGLEAAHEKSIVHRDLKPSNIKITPEGKVKILDFGLARAFLDKSPVGAIADSPTITAEMTLPGVILGTAAYMSPEQAKGRPVDKRADIWAFGCILFECLTGKSAFPGETITEVLAAVLNDEPDWDALPKDLPANIRTVLGWCLQKDRNLRVHEIADARIELFEAPAAQLTVESARRFPWICVGAVVAALAFGILIGFLVDRGLRKHLAVPVIRAVINLPPGIQLTRGSRGPTRTEIALAPDGSILVFSASPDGSDAKAMLYRRPLDRVEATAIPGTEGARAPFFSPDGKWIGFWAKRKLNKVAAKGGIPDAFCDVSEVPFGICWGLDGRVIFGARTAGLQWVSAAGGQPETLAQIDSGQEGTHRLPHLLPGGQALVFTAMPSRFGVAARIELLLLETHRREILIEDAADARYLPTGHLVFVRRGTLMAVPFDPDRLKITGSAVPVTAGLMQAFNAGDSYSNSGAAQYSFSESGILVFVSGGIFPDPEIRRSWVDRSGRAEPWTVMGIKPASSAGRISPDGRSAAFFTLGLDRNVWVYDIQRNTSTKLTSEGIAGYLAWTPDGKRLAFAWSKAGPRNIWWKPCDGSGEMQQLIKSDFEQQPGSWTRDGKYLALVESNPSTGYDILVLRMEDKSLIRFAATSASEAFPEFSPDGRWLAYASNESGRHEIYLRSFPGGDRRVTISNQGGIEPLWAPPDGRELFYWNPGNTTLMKVDISPGINLSPGTSKVLFKCAASGGDPMRSYDITPDGKRFLIGEPTSYAATEVTQLNLIQNWFEELNRLCPIKK